MLVEEAAMRLSRPVGSSGLRISDRKIRDTFHLRAGGSRASQVVRRAGGSQGGRAGMGAHKVGSGARGALGAAAGGCCCATGRPIEPDG